MKKITLLLSAILFTMMSFAGVVTFDADADQGNAGTDSNNAAAYQITKDGVTVEVSSGILGTYNNEMHYRIYKNQTLKITSTAGAITSVQFTCTANGDAKYGPGCFTVDGGDYTNDGGAVGTWTGSATEITFTASTNQVRASQIVVAVDGAVIPDNGGGDNGGDDNGGIVNPPVNPGNTTIEIPAEAQGWNIPAEAIDVLQARAICAGLESGATTGTKYYVMGYVKKIHNKHADGVTNYGNAQFYMENVNGANSEEDFMAFQVYGPNGQKITDANSVAVGDFVVVYGELTNYMGDTYETVGKGAAYIWNSTNPLLGGTTPPTPPTPPTNLVGDGTETNPYTVEDVLALNNTSKGPHYVKGFIIGQVNGASISSGLDTEAPFVGSTNSDGSIATQGTNLMIAGVAGDTINIVAVQLPKGSLRDEFNLVEHPEMLGAEVLICGSLEKYFGVAGIKSPTSITLLSEVGPSNVVNVTGLPYAEAYYYESDNAYEFMLYNFDEATEELLFPLIIVGVEAKSKTAINGAYEVIAAMCATGLNADEEFDGVYMGEEVGSLTIKNVDSEGNYSFVGSFVGEDGKIYKVNTIANVYALDDATGEDIALQEETETPPTPPTPPTGAIVFDADVDKGNAGTDSNNATAYQITKNGVTVEVTSGILGVYNNENHYRIYKNQTLTVTSTVGNIAKIEFTCTANDAEKYGPGCFTVTDGEYNYSGAVGTWTGDAAAVTFTASSNQVRATQIVVTLAGTTDVENVVVGQTPTKIIEKGQVLIIRGENIYNILGTQVK